MVLCGQLIINVKISAFLDLKKEKKKKSPLQVRTFLNNSL